MDKWEKWLLALVVIVVLGAVGGVLVVVNDLVTAPAEEKAKRAEQDRAEVKKQEDAWMENHVKFVRHPSTGICFARVSTTHSWSLSTVPCDAVKKELLNPP